MAEKEMMSQEEIDFAPGKNTFGKKMFEQKWRVGGDRTETWYKLGGPNGALVVAFDESGRIIVIEEFQPIPNRLPSCIGETIEEGEAPRAAARRGLLEETGYEAGELFLLTTIAKDVSNVTTNMSYFLATNCRKVCEPEKGISVVALPPLEFWRQFYSGLVANPGEVHDGTFTLQGVILAFAHLGIRII